jgi:hypothetical protein
MSVYMTERMDAATAGILASLKVQCSNEGNHTGTIILIHVERHMSGRFESMIQSSIPDAPCRKVIIP